MEMKYEREKMRIDRRAIAVRLRSVRRHLGYSQGEMADLLGITRDAYGKNERGSHLIRTENLHTLHEKLGVNVEWLLFDRGSMLWTSGDQGDETEEMIDMMKRLPLLRHTVMKCYQEFKIENKELINETLEKKED